MTSKLFKDQRGFTLPELLMTIVVLGILLAITIPSWNSYTEARRVESAQNQLVSDLRLASTQAQNRLIEIEVKLTASSDTYEMYNVDGGEPSMKRTLPDGTVTTSSETIRFNARGEAAGGTETTNEGDYVVRVATEDGDHPLATHISPATARVSAA